MCGRCWCSLFPAIYAEWTECQHARLIPRMGLVLSLAKYDTWSDSCICEGRYKKILKLVILIYAFSLFIAAHAAVVTNAIFAPCPEVIIKSQSNFMCDDDDDEDGVMHGEVLVSADYTGIIRVFINKFKPACD